VIGHFDLYMRRESALHRMDERAKIIALVGFVLAALIAPTRPVWPACTLFGLLGLGLVFGRVPPLLLARRTLLVALFVGLPLLVSRWGGEDARLAAEAFAVKSLLVAAAFMVLMTTTRTVDLLDATGRLPLLRGLSALAQFIVRGVNVLLGEVVRTYRAWALRAPRANLQLRVRGLAAASVSLVGRAAARSDRIGAAMVLRGFDGSLPQAPARSPAAAHLAIGVAFAMLSLAAAGIGRWT